MIIKSTRPATREELIQIINKLEKQLNKEKKKNKELQTYMKEYLIPKSTINLVYISKDKIKYKIEELDRELQLCEKQHIDTIKAYTPIDIIKAEIIKLQELLEERN